MNIKRMKQAGEELNEIIKLDVPIDLNTNDKEILTLDIEEVAAMLEKGDQISFKTAETIKELGFDIPKGVIILEEKKEKELNLDPINPPSISKTPTTVKTQYSKKPGVIKTILLLIDEYGPITKDEILEKLVEEFSDRKETAMKKTISAWLPNGFNKRKGLNIIKTKKGFINKTKK
jgi:hypothetical protein